MVFDLVFGQILMTKYYSYIQMIGSKLRILALELQILALEKFYE